MRDKFYKDFDLVDDVMDWVKQDDIVLIVKNSDGETEEWEHYLELDFEDGRVWPAIPPSARDEQNDIKDVRISENEN
jgi:hypothetical protein